VSKAERASSLLVNDAIPVLEKRGLVAERFSADPRRWSGIVRVPRRRKADGVDGWEGVSVRKQAIKEVEGRFVMCEIKCVYSSSLSSSAPDESSMIPSRSRGTALLTLTGDAEFNRYLRMRAYLHGERHLNMYGLWRARSHGEMEKIQWELVDAPSEEDVFRELEMPFVDPSQRGFLKKELKRRVLRSIEGDDGGELDTGLEEVP
jgi:DNA polymerase beta